MAGKGILPRQQVGVGKAVQSVLQPRRGQGFGNPLLILSGSGFGHRSLRE